ncbi:MAG: glyoxalase/bleomycin resistance/extradiol dioxygenase family protein [Pseudomonadales bacterium]|nr:glyoxalase/bleomycin resistance/extradiol dioxygenase family protein [Pseudomonadales bacterium]NIX09429.1 glyoxalase/bleomycin resistance/extradiol dioxygenase family protein [Pseudomonadales bacterium]
MRLQLALNVADIDEAVSYYSRILGVEANKREPGYANFVVSDPALKLVLFEAPGATERLNHLGFEAFSDADIEAAAQRLKAADVECEVQSEEVCCFAKQNKVVSYDPQGMMWEWYRVLEDSPTFFAEPETQSCCGPAEQSAG